MHHRSWLWGCYLPESTHRIRFLAVKAQFPVSSCLCSWSRECCVWVGGRKCEGWAVREFGMSELPSTSLSFACPRGSFIAAALCQLLAIGSDPQENRSKLSIIRANIAVYIFYFQLTPYSGRLYYTPCIWVFWGIIGVFWGICAGAAILCPL